MRVRIPGDRLKGKVVRLLEHAIQVGEDGWAEAGHLTDAEVNRCLKFGFRVEQDRGGKGTGPIPAQTGPREVIEVKSAAARQVPTAPIPAAEAK